jgi:hypothetical protein
MPLAPQELQIGGTSRGLESECQILNSTRILICWWSLILTFAKVFAVMGSER